MSLYREAGQNAKQGLIAGAVALIIGLGVGYLIGHSSAEEPTVADQIGTLTDELTPVSDGLELLGGEYPQAVKNGEIAAQTEYDGSVSNIERITQTVSDHMSDLEALDPEGTAQLQATLGDLLDAIQSQASTEEINRLRTKAADELEAILPATAAAG
jgi:hypothetical protein